jgi:hypothetical protein
MPPSLASRGRRLRGQPAAFRIDVAFNQFGAMFENVPQSGQDRLISATGRLVDALPIARARSPRKAANESRGKDAAWQVSVRRIPRNALRQIASNRGDRRSRDMRIGAGSKDLSDDHEHRSFSLAFSLGRAASYDNRICSQHVIALKNLLDSAKVNV